MQPEFNWNLLFLLSVVAGIAVFGLLMRAQVEIERALKAMDEGKASEIDQERADAAESRKVKWDAERGERLAKSLVEPDSEAAQQRGRELIERVIKADKLARSRGESAAEAVNAVFDEAYAKFLQMPLKPSNPDEMRNAYAEHLAAADKERGAL